MYYLYQKGQTKMKDIRKEHPNAIIQYARHTFKDGLVMTSSFGADSVVLLHMVTEMISDVPVIFIDTRYHFPETYQYVVRLVNFLGLNLKVYSGHSPETLERLYGKLWEQGEEGMKNYNNLQKVVPLYNALGKLNATAMISGIRAEQTENRTNTEVIEFDGKGNIFRIHPILNWTKNDIDEYLRKHGLPRHPLVAKGYESIGDWHSTLPGKGRSGRLLGQKQECGIHLDYEI